MTARVSRGQLFSRGAKGGAALLLAGSFAGSLPSAAAADTIPDGDLAYARLLVGAELLGGLLRAGDRVEADSAGMPWDLEAGASSTSRSTTRRCPQILSGAGQTPAVAADFDFSYPKGAFASRSSIAKLGVTLETAFLGAYLGAVDGLQTSALKQPVARIAASEAQHLSVFTRLVRRAIRSGSPSRARSTIDEASNALDAFTS